MTAATVHASVARVAGRGVLIRGASGSGKSALLMALLASRDADAVLVADDRVILSADGGCVVASTPPAIAGLMEIRGAGIMRYDHVPATAVDLVVDLKPLAECPRYPVGSEALALLEGIAVPRIFIAVGAHDGVARVIAALTGLGHRLEA